MRRGESFAVSPQRVEPGGIPPRSVMPPLVDAIAHRIPLTEAESLELRRVLDLIQTQCEDLGARPDASRGLPDDVESADAVVGFIGPLVRAHTERIEQGTKSTIGEQCAEHVLADVPPHATLLDAIVDRYMFPKGGGSYSDTSSPRLECGGWCNVREQPDGAATSSTSTSTKDWTVLLYAWRYPRAARWFQRAVDRIYRRSTLLGLPSPCVQPLQTTLCHVGGHRVSAIRLLPLRSDTFDLARASSGPHTRTIVEDIRGLLCHCGNGAAHGPSFDGGRCKHIEVSWTTDGRSVVVAPSIDGALTGYVGDADSQRYAPLMAVTPSVYLQVSFDPLAADGCEPNHAAVGTSSPRWHTMWDAVWERRGAALLATFVRMSVDREPSLLDLPPTFIGDVCHAHGVPLRFLRLIRTRLIERLHAVGCGNYGVVHKVTTDIVARTLKRMCYDFVGSVTNYATEGDNSGAASTPGRQQTAAPTRVTDSARHDAQLPQFVNRVVSKFLTKPNFVVDVLWPSIVALYPTEFGSQCRTGNTPRLSASVLQRSSPPTPQHACLSPTQSPLHAGPNGGASPSPSLIIELPMFYGGGKQRLSVLPLDGIAGGAPRVRGPSADNSSDPSEFDFAKVSLPDVLRYLSYALGIGFSSSTKQFDTTLVLSPQRRFCCVAPPPANYVASLMAAMVDNECREAEGLFRHSVEPFHIATALHLDRGENQNPQRCVELGAVTPRSPDAAVVLLTALRIVSAKSMSELRRRASLEATLGLFGGVDNSAEALPHLRVASLLLCDAAGGCSGAMGCASMNAAVHGVFPSSMGVPQTRCTSDGDAHSAAGGTRASLGQMFCEGPIAMYCVVSVLQRTLDEEQQHLTPDVTARRSALVTVSRCAAFLCRWLSFCGSRSTTTMQRDSTHDSGAAASLASVGTTRLHRVLPTLAMELAGMGPYGRGLQATVVPDKSLRVLPDIQPGSLQWRLLLWLLDTADSVVEDLLYASEHREVQAPAGVLRGKKKKTVTTLPAPLPPPPAQSSPAVVPDEQLLEQDDVNARCGVHLEAMLLLYGSLSSSGTPWQGIGLGSSPTAVAHRLLRFLVHSGLGLVGGKARTRCQSVQSMSSLAIAVLQDVLLVEIQAASGVSVERATLTSGDGVVKETSVSGAEECMDVGLLSAVLALPFLTQHQDPMHVASEMAGLVLKTEGSVQRAAGADAAASTATLCVDALFACEDWLRAIHEACMRHVRLTNAPPVEEGTRTSPTAKSPSSGGLQQKGPASLLGIDAAKTKLICEFILSAMEASPEARELLSDVEVIQYPMHRGDRSRRNVPADVMASLVGGPHGRSTSIGGGGESSSVMVLRRVPSTFGIASPTKHERGDDGASPPSLERRRSSLHGSGVPTMAPAASEQLLMVQSTDEALKRLSLSWAARKEKLKSVKQLPPGSSVVAPTNAPVEPLRDVCPSSSAREAAAAKLRTSLTTTSLVVGRTNKSQALRHSVVQDQVLRRQHADADTEALLQRREDEEKRKREREMRKILAWELKQQQQQRHERTVAKGQHLRKQLEQAFEVESDDGRMSQQDGVHDCAPTSASRDDGPFAQRALSVPPPATTHPTRCNATNVGNAAHNSTSSVQRVREDAKAWLAKEEHRPSIGRSAKHPR